MHDAIEMIPIGVECLLQPASERHMYVSDFSAGKVWRIRPDMRFEVIAEFLSTPADLGIDRKNHLILVPYHYGNAAEINGLERPSTGGNSKKRSLADYGFDGMKKGAGQ